MRIRHFTRLWVFALLGLLPATNLVAQQQTGSLRGRVLDQSGAVMPGVPVTLTAADKTERTATTGADGSFAFDALPAGTYAIRTAAPNFAPFRKTGLTVTAGRRTTLDITLKVMLQKQQVDVTGDAGVSVDPEASAGAIVIKGEDLEALPDDPDELADVLQAMAGPSAGPNGGQFFIDGFTGSQLPPKEAIREIRINQNPFSAEFDRIGFGRIEIFTRPGMDKYHGSLMFNFNNQALNSRNPFDRNPTKPDYMSRMTMGSLGGPLLKNRSSFFVSFHRNEQDDNALIRAQILDTNLNPLDVSQVVVTPRRSMEINPRIDFKINDKNTLVFSSGYDTSSRKNSGVGGFSLLSRASQSKSTEQTYRITETSMVNTKTVNETRFQLLRPSSDQRGDNTIPAINVQSAFNGGGAQVGHNYNSTDRLELQNYTTRAAGRQTIKFGFRMRRVGEDDYTASNFGGTYTFAGGFGPQLDANNAPIAGTRIALNSLERYRRTLLFQGLGMTPDQIRALGGGASQFSLMVGSPDATIGQFDIAPFIQDDWKVRSNLTLSGGLRYETQTNISARANFGPRLALAWAPRSSTGQGKTVLRGGFGFFYDRFSEGLVLQTRRYDGQHQQQFIVDERTDPTVLNLFPKVPSPSQLATYMVQQTVRTIGSAVRSPYSVSGSFSVERQLPKGYTMAVTYIRTRGVHVLRTRNINAPLPNSITAANPSGIRPYGNVGNIYEYETTGTSNQNRMIVMVSNRVSRRFSVSGNYSYGNAKSDADGSGSFPSNSYDMSHEWGRSSFDIRHSMGMFGSLNLPFGVSLSPILSMSSGRPFNITTGQSTNGDSVRNERPTFATDMTRPSVRVTKWGAFDLVPLPGAVVIPRNYGQGPGSISFNLRMSKTIGIGLRQEARAARAAGSATTTAQGGEGDERRGPPPGMMMGGGPGGGGPGGGGPRGSPGGRGGGGFTGGSRGSFGSRGGSRGGRGGSSDYRYGLSLSVSAHNVLNHVNLNSPVADLSSPLFGQSTNVGGGFGGFGGGGDRGGSAGNRRIELQLRLSF
jgi:hypothetical protein